MATVRLQGEKEKTIGIYKATMDSFEASGDAEMTAVYAAYSKEVISK